MAFRTEIIQIFKTIVICDDCKKEKTLCENPSPIGFDGRMNEALRNGYTFKDTGKQFKNYCKDCKVNHE